MPVDRARFDPAVLDRLRCEVGDEEVMTAFVRSYLELLEARAGALRAADAVGDGRRLWEVAASLAATSAMVGAAGLAGWCQEVQEQAKGASPGSRQEDLAELDELISATSAALRDALDEGSTGQPVPRR